MWMALGLLEFEHHITVVYCLHGGVEVMSSYNQIHTDESFRDTINTSVVGWFLLQPTRIPRSLPLSGPRQYSRMISELVTLETQLASASVFERFFGCASCSQLLVLHVGVGNSSPPPPPMLH